MSLTKPKRNPPRIEMRLEGPAVPGRISIDMLATVARELQTSLRRMLASPRRGGGRFPAEVEQPCSLDLTGFEKGSAVLTFEYAGERTSTLHGDLGVRAAEEMLAAMQGIEDGRSIGSPALPPAVIDGFDTLTQALEKGVDSIRLKLMHGSDRHEAKLTRAFRSNLRGTMVRETAGSEQTIEGVLWECDWKEHTATLEEIDGRRLALEFTASLEEQVTALRRQRVRVRGVVEGGVGRGSRMVLASIVAAGDVAVTDPRYGGFWDNLSTEELIRRQGTGPISDFEALAIGWPEDESLDDFLATIRGALG